MPFRSRRYVNVFANAIGLIDDEYDPIKNIIVGSILTEQDLTRGLINNALTGSSIQIHRMLNYAREHYTLGLPEGMHYQTSTLNNVDVANAITADLALPYGCLVDYNFIAELTVYHIILPFLLDQRQYNITTRRVFVYPPEMNLPTLYQNKPLSYRVFANSATYNEDQVSVTILYRIESFYQEYQYKDDERVRVNIVRPVTYFEENYILPSTQMRIGNFYCRARYHQLDSQGEVSPDAHWWLYDISTKIYPAIDFDYTFGNTDSLFPVIPLRYRNVDLTAESKYDTDLYKTSKQLLKIVNIKINDLGDVLNENPDVKEIDHAYIIYGINLQSNQKESIHYLVEFFDFLYDRALIRQTTNLNHYLSDNAIPTNLYSFNRAAVNTGGAASLVEHGLDASISFSHITSTYVNGSIGVVGSATKSMVPRFSQHTTNWGDESEVTEIDNSELILRYQETQGAYKEVRVIGLTHINHIYQEYTVTTTLSDIIKDPEDGNFIIPLHYAICKKFPITTRNRLYNQALHIVIYGIQQVTVKWYESGFLKFILLVVSLVIAAYTGEWRLFYFVFIMELLTLFLPPKVMIALRIVWILYSIYTLNAGGLVNAGMSTAQYFLSMVSALVQLATAAIEVRLLDTMEEMEGLAVKQKTALKELEEIAQQLDTSSFLDAGLLLDPPRLGIVPNESPTAFYTRTLMNNAGLLVLDVVENYHEALLLLPEPDYNTAFNIS